MLPKAYDPFLVVLSFLVAWLASYTALTLAARLKTRSGRLRIPWLVGGALVQGAAIWAMHFTGMLALQLPIPISYEASLVALSFVVAFVGSLIALFLIYLRRLHKYSLLGGGIAFGAAISGLHYIDMAAMRMPAMPVFRVSFVILSIGVASGFGLLALALCRRYKEDDPREPHYEKWMVAGVLAIAIAGHHYTAMAGAEFATTKTMAVGTGYSLLPQHRLPDVIAILTLGIVIFALGGAAWDRRIATRRSLSMRLLAAEEGERRRIARVLHEDVGQSLTALRLNLERLHPGDDDTRLVRDSVGLVDDALARLRALSVELRPTVLDDLGLGQALIWYANRQGERAGYSVTVDDALGDVRLPEVVETSGFRIAQQALTNIARHARATNVRIGLRQYLENLELSIKDDGVGFDVRDAQVRARAGESLGLLDIEELANLAGGTVTVASSPERGTTVVARLPLGGD
jgi:signal transduction histidine kinase